MRRSWIWLVVLVCMVGRCGDDDGSDINQNNQNNTTGTCGDGVVNTGEGCDLGPANSDSEPNGCRTDCRSAWCGDGVQDSGEACDDGNGSNEDACLTACNGTDDCCLANICGDGFENKTTDGSGFQVEACDDGNTQDGDLCAGDCQQDFADCGNGVLDKGEQCDQGPLNSDTLPDRCRKNCRLPHCGDGVKDPSEACDGTDFGTATCSSESYPGGGSLGCTNSCQISTSSCCQDGDGDGYGDNCTLGPDCADDAEGLTGPCEADGCPAGWTLVDAGGFDMGCNAGELDNSCRPEEQGRHTVTLGAYCIQITETTVTQYRQSVAAGVVSTLPATTGSSSWCNYSPTAMDREQHPVNCLAWAFAQTYCQGWYGGDLPTEAQWEKAARGTTPTKYPWGDTPEPNCTLANYDFNGGDPDASVPQMDAAIPGYDAGPPADAEVDTTGYGCAEATTGPGTWDVGDAVGDEDSPYGAVDMAGNVAEWTRDCYDASVYSTCQSGCSDPVNTSTGCGYRVVRGGSFVGREGRDFTKTPLALRVVAREFLGHDDVATSYREIGFRCVRPVP